MHDPDPAAGDPSGLFSLLYVSVMAKPDADELGRICEQSRTHNLRDGITGLLVFDGHAFCQFVEGEKRVIEALLARLESDPRHHDMRVLQYGPLPGPRRFPRWRLGYAYCADASAIARLETTRAEAAIGAFERWAPELSWRGQDDD